MASRSEGLKRCLTNLRGRKSRRRLLVIESDDWGMVRMASPDAFQRLRGKGYPVDECPYNRYDMLESRTDVEALSEVLSKHRDGAERPAILTANMVMGNPDFEAIRDGGFEHFQAQPFWDTLRDYGQADAIDAYRQAHDAGVLKAQLHGRDHVAVDRWLSALKDGDERFRDAFSEGMYTVHPGGATGCRRDLLDALGLAPGQDGFSALTEGLQQAQSWFVDLWGVASRSFIAPCYTWHPALEPKLAGLGVRYLQGSRVQRVPTSSPKGSIQRERHFTGQRNAHGQRYLVRNVSLEPSIVGDADACLDQALVEVRSAFQHRTPAIVSSHRLNYMGGLDASNRDRGLRVLDTFLTTVRRTWPDVEFVSTDELGRLMEA